MPSEGDQSLKTTWLDVEGVRIRCLTAARADLPCYYFMVAGSTRQASLISMPSSHSPLVVSGVCPD